MKPARIGPMRYRITIERKAKTGDALRKELNWTERHVVWAAMKHGSSSLSRGAGDQLSDQTFVTFTIRKSGAVGTRQGDRVVYRGRYFYIESVNNADERDRYLTLVTREREQG